jgi:hypothetical protein
MNVVGLHEYAGIKFLQRADEWSWRRQDYFDRPWVSQRKSSA